MKKKFDLMYEKLLMKINEKEYHESSLGDNIKLFIKLLRDNDLLEKNVDVDRKTEEVLSQPNNIKQLSLDTEEQAMPPIKVLMSQNSDSESFTIKVVNLKDAAKPQVFTNSMLETVFDDALTAIKTMALQGIQPEAAVDELPSEGGANAQPGAGGSALPKGNEPPAPEQPPANA